MTLSLSEDVIRSEILTRLPVKSLLRFRSVCKTWRSIVSDPAFIISHCTTTQNPNHVEYVLWKSLWCYPLSRIYHLNLLSSHTLSQTKLSNNDYPEYACLLGSINGLICFFTERLHQFVLWNPAIRQAKNINAPFRYPNLNTSCLFGFCWDAVEHDLKLVFSYKHNDNISIVGHQFGSYVYSCNTDSWTLLPDSPYSERTAAGYYCWWPAIVNEMPYWTHTKSCGKKNIFVFTVTGFEVGRNEFRMLPELIVSAGPGHHDSQCVIVNIKECISAVVYISWGSVSLLYVYCLDDRCGVWNKMCTVGPGPCADIMSRCFKYGGEILFEAGGKLMCYDGKTNQIKGFGNLEGYLHNCFKYKASLVFLQGMKPLNERSPIL